MALYRVIPAGDVALTNGAARVVGRSAYVRQKLAARFKFFLGEWFLDRREGVPYYRDVLVHNPDLLLIRSIFRRVALSVQGIVELQRFELVYDAAKRNLAFDIVAILDDGETLVVQTTDEAFIITDIQQAA